MTLDTLNQYSLYWIAFALLLVPVLLKVKQPYGKHISSKWGPLIDNKLGWVLQEIPSPIVLTFFFFSSGTQKPLLAYLLWLLWVLHYFYRSIIFPLRTRTSGKKIPLLIVFFAICFNSVNGFLNGSFLGEFVANNHSDNLFFLLRIMVGFSLFIIGVIINHQSDNILLHLRKPGQTDYQIPAGKWYKFVSCPNYMGEIIEWSGFAIMAWGLPALSFAVWTAVNLIPRAIDHHRWYQENFANYPKERKAIIPFVL